MAYPGPAAPPHALHLLAPLFEATVDLLYPRCCSGCQAPLDRAAPRVGAGAWFCRGCAAGLPLMEPPCCKMCGEAYDGAFTNEFRCANCSGRRLEFDFAVAACRAEGLVRDLVHQFKYGRRVQLRGALAALLQRTLEEPRLVGENLADWLLVPVPLHRSREADRAFNQSWELCQRLAKWTGIPAANVLVRSRATESQARLDRDERLRNLRGAFEMRRPRRWQPPVCVRARRILLVDDVFTTGATSSECARVLRRQGQAEKVVVITAARG